MNLIPDEILKLSKVQYFRPNRIHELMQQENDLSWRLYLRNMPEGELRPDTTGKVDYRLGEAIWKQITACLP